MNKILGYLFCFVLISSFSCINKYQQTKCGIVVYKIFVYNNFLKKYIQDELFVPEVKVWYRDSTVIMKVKGLTSTLKRATNREGTSALDSVMLMHFMYIDLKKMTFYKYLSFTDTAALIEKYTETQMDTVVNGVNWKFYKKSAFVMNADSMQILPDTIIDGNLNKRIQYIVKRSDDSTKSYLMVFCFDCTKKGTIFSTSSDLSVLSGCPFVSSYTQISSNFPTGTASKIEFISDKLTNEEQKVFDAWERNARKYPVKK
jgi:hypothetical protein